jgi:glutaminyl-tRNA synthetase
VAKEIFIEMLKNGGDPLEIVQQKGLEQVSTEDALLPIVETVLGRFPDKVMEYRDGRLGLLGFFIGEVMRASEGRANPEIVKSLVQQKLS